MFFKMVSGSIEKPETIVIEVIDFFLMDIGSHTFTSTSYGESGGDLMEYQMENPHTMEDGVRLGYCHSHHRMPTFYSGEDVDDMVVNTRDKDLDYYVTMIINNHGDWISRIAFRIEETISQKVKQKFWSSMMMNKWSNNSEREFVEPVLIMIPLNVEQEGYDEANTVRFKKLDDIVTKREEEAKKTRESMRTSFTVLDKSYLPNYLRNSKQPGLFDNETGNEMSDDLLMGKLMTGSITYNGGLDAAVKAFDREVRDKDGKIYEQMVALHAETICANAQKIVELSEGGKVSTMYVIEVLADLEQNLINDYIDYDKDDEVLPENKAIDMLTDELDGMLNMMDETQEDTIRKSQHENRTGKHSF